MRTRAEETVRRRALQAESLLGGTSDKDLTDVLRGSGWPGAARTLTELLVLDGLPEQPYCVELGDTLYADAEGSVTYASPVRLHASRDASAKETPSSTSAPSEAPVETPNA